MSGAQEKFYWRLWSMARKADPATDRKALHAKLGLPESHVMFSQEDFDAWKSRCLALAQPSNFVDQIKTVEMPRTRRIWLAQHLCAALGQDAGYAVRTMRQMNRAGGFGHGEIEPGELALEDLSEEDLDGVITALRKACRRQWPTKLQLIGAIHLFCRENEMDDRAAKEAAVRALNLAILPPLHELPWDKLIVVFSVMRGLCVEVPF